MIASATPEQYEQAIVTLLTSDDIDALIILYIAVTATDVDPIADGIRKGMVVARATEWTKKPVYIGWMVETDRERRFSLLNDIIPTFGLPELPARVLGKIVRYVQWRDRPAGMVPDFDDLDLPTITSVCHGALTTKRRRLVDGRRNAYGLERDVDPAAAGRRSDDGSRGRRHCSAYRVSGRRQAGVPYPCP